MADVLAWNSASQFDEVVRRAVEALAAGQLVAFPTETVYGLAANAALPDAVARLAQSKGRAENKPLTVALASPADVLHWAPDLSPLGRRLARRCWPGPVTLVCRAGTERGLLSQLPEVVRQRLSPQGTLGLRVPAHGAVLQTLEQVSFPIVLTSANRSSEPAAVTAAEVVAAVGEDLALVIDGGPCHYGRASTVVQVEGDRWRILREGVVTTEELQRLSTCVIVLVCTGNTCRSPMAEALLKKLLAERLGSTPAELPERGFLVLSAGVAALAGGNASPEAVEAVRELGGDLSSHVSRPASEQLVAEADYVLAMTRGHLEVLEGATHLLGGRLRLLATGDEEISDPFGGDLEEYRACARQILRHLESFVAELPLP